MKRRFYTIKFKLEVISYAKEHGNRAAQRNFGPDESQVRYWRRQEQRLRSAVGKRKKACLRHGNVKWPDLEKELKDWVVNNRNSGYCDTTKMIMNHSREIARTRGVVGFRGSSSWWVAFLSFFIYFSKHPCKIGVRVIHGCGLYAALCLHTVHGVLAFP